MEGTTKSPVELAIAHVLFIDIVGYSKLTTKEQNAAVATLNDIVQRCEPFQRAEKAERLLKIPTGDGMALVFHSSPEEPVQCAIAISRALKEYPTITVRMGVHSGSVSGVVDVTGRANVAGAGINITQRVMDCADAGHILLSKHAADDLAEYEQWRPMLHDLGPCEVKHGLKVHIVSLWNDDVGNHGMPSKLRAQTERHRRRQVMLLGGAVAVLAIAASLFLLWRNAEKHASLTSSRNVAVLPFENLSTAEENAIFAGGVHREILLNLAKLSELKVISRTSVMQYAAGAGRNLKKIASELGVSHVVEGSVQREGDRIRVTAQLIDASTDAPVWAEAYDRDLADVFAIQSEIAQKISDQLGAQLSAMERTALTTKATQNVGAFELYIKARALMDTPPDKVTFDDNMAAAAGILKQAVTLDPQFAVGYAALAEASTQLYRTNLKQESRAQAEAALKEAKRISPDLGEVHFAQAIFDYYCDHDFPRALATLELAARSLPNNDEILTLRGLLERRLGRWEEAFRHFQRAMELNPRDSIAYGHAAGTAWAARRLEDALRIMNAVIDAFPAEADSYRAWKGYFALVNYGDIPAARRELESIRSKDDKGILSLAFDVPFAERNFAEAEQALNDFATKVPVADSAENQARLAIATNTTEQRRESLLKTLARCIEQAPKPPNDPPSLRAQAFLHAALGNKEEAIRFARRAVELFPVKQNAVDGSEMIKLLAAIYALTGEKDLAFETLLTLVQSPKGVHYGELKTDPVWDNLRSDPRFAELLKRAMESDSIKAEDGFQTR